MNYNLGLLRLIRTSKDLTLKDFSKSLGISYQKLSEIERGYSIPKKSVIEAIEKTLGINLENDTESDKELLLYYEKFVNHLFNGYNDIDEMQNELRIIKNKCSNSKFLYYIPVFEYIIGVIKYNNNDDYGISKYLEDDKKIYLLYLIYKAKKYRKSDINKSLFILDDVICGSVDIRLNALAEYHKALVYVSNYKPYEALESIKEAKRIFENKSAYIRCYACDVMKFEALSINFNYNEAISLAYKCLESVDALNLSNRHRGRLYRNIAFTYILTKDYSKAIETLGIAEKIDEKNHLLIMYYIYVYSLNEDYDNAKYWINIADNVFVDKDMLMELSFWKSYNKYKNINDLIKKSINIVSYYYKLKYYDAFFFQIDVLILLFEKNKNYKEAYGALKFKEELIYELKNN